jgi:uncharacterized protein (DUF433 family)
MTDVLMRYITSDPNVLYGEPIVVGSIVAVRDIVQLWESGIKPEAMVRHLFNRVTIAQIFDALSFYADYPEEVNVWIEKYAGHPAPLLRLNPLQDEVSEAIVSYRQEVDANIEADAA